MVDSATTAGTRNPSSSFLETSPISRGLAGLISFLFILGIVFPSMKNVLALVPGYTIPPHFYVWNIFTSSYYEVSTINAVANAVSLLWYGKYLEAIWGPKEFFKFIVIVNSLCGVGTFCVMVILYILSGDLGLWFDSRICGFSGAIAGFAVAMKQLIPEQELIPNFPLIRAKHSFAMLILLNVALISFAFIPSESIFFTLLGVVFSWIYLRFFQVKADNVVGDMNESFSFASFFPEFMQVPVRITSNITFNLLKICRCCPPSIQEPPDSSLSEVSDADSSRRRARALQVLDQRIQQMKQFGQTDISTVTNKSVDIQEV